MPPDGGLPGGGAVDGFGGGPGGGPCTGAGGAPADGVPVPGCGTALFPVASGAGSGGGALGGGVGGIAGATGARAGGGVGELAAGAFGSLSDVTPYGGSFDGKKNIDISGPVIWMPMNPSDRFAVPAIALVMSSIVASRFTSASDGRNFRYA